MKEIGGYFELELKKGNPYFSDSIELNTGRNCFEYILRAKEINEIYIPHYICDVMLEPLKKLGIEYNYYHLDLNLEPEIDLSGLDEIPVLYVNYFGIKQDYIQRAVADYPFFIIDNTMAFFQPPIPGVDTFYSTRKFFGVPDGAYLFTDKRLKDSSIEQDYAHNRALHLLKRIEDGADPGYKQYVNNDYSLYNQPIRKMSGLTKAILNSIDYEYARLTRERNFMYLHNEFRSMNELKIELESVSGPMYYPLLFRNSDLREYLVKNKIYVTWMWKNVIKTVKINDLEHHLTNHMFTLPIDQRYGLGDMKHIKSVIRKLL